MNEVQELIDATYRKMDSSAALCDAIAQYDASECERVGNLLVRMVASIANGVIVTHWDREFARKSLELSELKGYVKTAKVWREIIATMGN